MDAIHYTFEFWSIGKDSINDRMLYVVLGTDVDDAKKRLCELMRWKRIPAKLTVRINLLIASIG
jgi:hypothetical protein